MQIQPIIATHPQVKGSLNDALIRAIEQALDCAQICGVCADACLAEEQVAMMRQCIRLNLDCADVCAATAKIAARRTGSNEELILNMLQVCADVCIRCAEECERHADKHEHCRLCAEACRRCESACRSAAPTIRAQ
jgi:hypothetical protein